MTAITKNQDRARAILEGRKHYLSSTPCKHGHVGLRYVSNRKCVECMKFKDTTVDVDTPRGKARAAGEVRYTPDKPCVRGHMCERYVVNNRCVECDNMSCRTNHASYASKYERTRTHKLKTLYGITPAQFDQMCTDQNNACAICSSPFETRKQAHVDHNHETGSVRGLLCTRCNMGIGYFRENVHTMLAAVLYVIQHSTSILQDPTGEPST